MRDQLMRETLEMVAGERCSACGILRDDHNGSCPCQRARFYAEEAAAAADWLAANMPNARSRMEEKAFVNATRAALYRANRRAGHLDLPDTESEDSTMLSTEMREFTRMVGENPRWRPSRSSGNKKMKFREPF